MFILLSCLLARHVNIHVIDKHLYISCESEKRTCLLTKDDKHAICIFCAVIELMLSKQLTQPEFF